MDKITEVEHFEELRPLQQSDQEWLGTLRKAVACEDPFQEFFVHVCFLEGTQVCRSCFVASYLSLPR